MMQMQFTIDFNSLATGIPPQAGTLNKWKVCASEDVGFICKLFFIEINTVGYGKNTAWQMKTSISPHRKENKVGICRYEKPLPQTVIHTRNTQFYAS